MRTNQALTRQWMKLTVYRLLCYVVLNSMDDTKSQKGGLSISEAGVINTSLRVQFVF